MNYIPVPLARIELGKPVPVSLWDARGHLLLRKGQAIESEHQKEVLATHQASATAADFRAWQRSYDRSVYLLLRAGCSVEEIANAPMPSEIEDADYAVGHEVVGGWLDVQAALCGLMVQGDSARNALERIEGVCKRASELLDANADESLFHLYQALADTTLGYCATHGLLCAVLCRLTARKLEVPAHLQAPLFQAAMLMNIGMAREQDQMALQKTRLADWQRSVIAAHAGRSAALLKAHELHDADVLDLVAHHHDVDEQHGHPANLAARRILRTADAFVAKMASRKTRHALSALGATRSLLVGATGELARTASAMASVVGFYPPGTYVSLPNGDLAVAVRRGPSATTPVVVSIVNKDGIALAAPVAHDTRDKAHAIVAAINAGRVKLTLNAQKVIKAAARIDITAG